MSTERVAAGTPVFWGRRPTSKSRLYQPGRPAFWILAAFFCVAAVLGGWQYVLTFASPNAPFRLGALVLWAAWALVIAWLLGLMDVFAHVPRTVRLAALAWGAFVTVLMSGPLVGVIGGLAEPLVGQFVFTVSSPGAEEAAKYLGVALIAATVPCLFRRPVAGIMCGMLAGLGFSYFENMGMTNATVDEMGGADPISKVAAMAAFWWDRGVTDTPVAHLVFTGLTCLGIVYWVAHPEAGRWRRLLVALGFFLAGVFLHALNNFLVAYVTTVPPSVASAVFAANQVLQAAVFIGMIVYAVRSERRWFRGPELGELIPSSVIDADERAELITRRARRAAGRARLLQRSQIGYADAVADPAPQAELHALAAQVQRYRDPVTEYSDYGPDIK